MICAERQYRKPGYINAGHGSRKEYEKGPVNNRESFDKGFTEPYEFCMKEHLVCYANDIVR